MAQPKEPVRANADASPLSRDAVVENYAEGIEVVVSGLAGAARARTLVDSSTGSQP
jgi:ribosomal protein S3